MEEATQIENALQAEELTETPIEATEDLPKKKSISRAAFLERFRASLLWKYADYVGQGMRLREMERVTNKVMADVALLEEIWQRIVNTLDVHKFSFDRGTGIFLHDRQTLMQSLETLTTDLKRQIADDTSRYKANLEAGKGANKEYESICFSIGEPLKKTEQQVSNNNPDLNLK